MKKDKIIFWIATGFIFLFEGIMPLSALLFAPESALGSTLSLGYPSFFGYSLIAFKVAGSILLVIPKLPRAIKEWTYAGFAFNFLFASISHLVVDQNVGFILLPLIVFAILIVSYVNYFKIYQNETIKFQAI